MFLSHYAIPVQSVPPALCLGEEMIGADTVKVAVPRDALRWFNPDHFSTLTTMKAGGELQNSHLLMNEKARPLGLSMLKIYDERIVAELSSKILGEDYIQRITENNVERVPELMGKTGSVDFDPEIFVSGAELHRIDITTNIVPYDLRAAIYACSTGSMNGRWNHKDYGGKRDDGFEYTGRRKSEKRRFIGYDKYREMMSRGQIKHADELGVDSFRGVLRFEGNLRTHKDIRRELGIETLKLTDALASSLNPNLRMFDEIIYSISGKDHLVEMNEKLYKVKEMGMRLFKEVTTMELMFELTDGDWAQIERFVRSGYGERSEPKRELKKWRDHLATWKLSKRTGTGERDMRTALEEVRDLLQAA